MGGGSDVGSGELECQLSRFCFRERGRERFPLPLGAWDGLRYLLWHSLSLSYNYFGIIAFRAIQVQNADFFQMVHHMPLVLQQRRILKVI